jgi:hypothetical protein
LYLHFRKTLLLLEWLEDSLMNGMSITPNENNVPVLDNVMELKEVVCHTSSLPMKIQKTPTIRAGVLRLEYRREHL